MLGTYSTLDCPFDNDASEMTRRNDIINAKEFLIKKFDVIGGHVKIRMNPHDFGSYPSFEIDYSPEIEEIIDLPEEDRIDEEQDKVNKWHEDANKIETDYYKAFERLL